MMKKLLAVAAFALSSVAIPATAHAASLTCSAGFAVHIDGAGFGIADGHLHIAPGSTGDTNGDGFVCIKFVGRPESDAYPIFTVKILDDH